MHAHESELANQRLYIKGKTRPDIALWRLPADIVLHFLSLGCHLEWLHLPVKEFYEHQIIRNRTGLDSDDELFPDI